VCVRVCVRARGFMCACMRERVRACVRARARARVCVCVCVCVCVGLMCFILWLVGECVSLIFSLSSRYLLSRLRECIVYGDNTASLQIFYSF